MAEERQPDARTLQVLRAADMGLHIAKRIELELQAADDVDHGKVLDVIVEHLRPRPKQIVWFFDEPGGSIFVCVECERVMDYYTHENCPNCGRPVVEFVRKEE